LIDRFAPNILCKKNKSRKLKNNKEFYAAYYNRTNFKLVLNNFKKVKKNILAPLRKRKRFKKNLLFVNNSIKIIIVTQLNIYKKVINTVSRVRTGVELLKNIIKIIKAGINTAKILNILNYYV